MPTLTTKTLTTLKIAKRYHHTIESRFAIVQYATDHGMKGAARRFGLDRNTVRAWRRRWQAADVAGLVPRYPLIRARRIADSTVALIEHARRDLKYGAVRTRMWLERVHRLRVAAATIRRICHRLGYPPLRRKPQRRPRQLPRFSRERPGHCGQVDVKEVRVAGTKDFQYTAIDDGTRYRILRLYPQNHQHTSHTFFTTLRTTLPFPIRKLQVDNGPEFSLAFALTVQQAGMRLRDITPRCPEQNGNVERSHQVDDEACWSRSPFAGFTPAAEAWLAWEHRSNHERFSLALNGLTPTEKLSTFASASSPLPSVAILQSPSSALGSTLDRLPIVAPDPNVQATFSQNHDLNPGAAS